MFYGFRGEEEKFVNQFSFKPFMTNMEAIIEINGTRK